MNQSKVLLKPVMVLLGNPGQARLEMRQRWMDQALPKEQRELNFQAFQLGEDSLAAALQACRDFPCFAERRVVLVKDLHKLKKKEGEILKAYLQAPVDSSVLIFEADKLDGRLDWVKALKAASQTSTLIYELQAFSTSEAVNWVERTFQERQLKIEPGVAERLVELLGPDLGALTQAVEQLSLFVESDESIQLKHLEELFVQVSDENIFEVLEALFLGNLAELYRGLGRMLETGEAPLRILALVYRHLSILLALRFSGEALIWQNFRMPPMARSRYISQVQRFGSRLNYSVLKPLTEMDRKLKSSPLSGERVLKEGIREVAELLG